MQKCTNMYPKKYNSNITEELILGVVYFPNILLHYELI